jgi:hypothetical protein
VHCLTIQFFHPHCMAPKHIVSRSSIIRFLSQIRNWQENKHTLS